MMTFSEALTELKRGAHVKRSGWNGKDQYIYLIHDVCGMDLDGEECCCFEAIAFHGTKGVQIGWLASQADMLTDDWEVI